jgi:hypothetical protein
VDYPGFGIDDRGRPGAGVGSRSWISPILIR